MLTALELVRYEEIPTQVLASKKDEIRMRQKNVFSQLLEKPKDFKICLPSEGVYQVLLVTTVFTISSPQQNLN